MLENILRINDRGKSRLSQIKEDKE